MKRLSITILICAVALLGASACQRSASTAPEGVGQPTSNVPDSNIGSQPTLPVIDFPTEAVSTPEPVFQPTADPVVVTTPETQPEVIQADATVRDGIPATYTLQKGEFPFCIARRYNVDPYELLKINGLAPGQIYYAGRVLTMPTSGAVFPVARALRTHPANYTVTSTSETLRSVACVFGDVDPSALASANGLASADAPLTVGKVLSIP